MRPLDNEPNSNEIETLLEDEERRILDNPIVPDEVKAEVTERLQHFEDELLEEETEDGPPPGDRRY